MSITKLAPVAFAAAAFLGAHTASAKILFCNQFPHQVYVAMAYQQESGSWLSRGWINLNTGDCSLFDSAIRVKTFYYHAESEPYRANGRRGKLTWGKSNRSFAINEDSNFEYWGAETRVLNSTLVPFSSGPELQSNDPNASVSTTITFNSDGTSSIEIK
jgi:uncharacterized membrane protein